MHTNCVLTSLYLVHLIPFISCSSLSLSLSLSLAVEAEELYQKRVLTITGICVALLVVGIVCVVAYCKTKKQRKKMHNHLRQNLCADHQNRNLANGPNHPGPLPEDIQMVDYVSKNVPASEHVRRHETETSFSGSQPSSTSHRSSTATHTSSHSVEQTESMTSEMHSGMMTSSLDTSKCNSPVEPRGRLSAVCGFHDTRHPMLYCRDSVDSLRDSPHSDRWGRGGKQNRTGTSRTELSATAIVTRTRGRAVLTAIVPLRKWGNAPLS
uniref:Neuregulin C-terminal domain-containing protein n=1 Tax=Callorhinchus milii TaxID=7868 RepID=A0A4W3HC47_CALMI